VPKSPPPPQSPRLGVEETPGEVRPEKGDGEEEGEAAKRVQRGARAQRGPGVSRCRDEGCERQLGLGLANVKLCGA
jgi:hypothetical protein